MGCGCGCVRGGHGSSAIIISARICLGLHLKLPRHKNIILRLKMKVFKMPKFHEEAADLCIAHSHTHSNKSALLHTNFWFTRESAQILHLINQWVFVAGAFLFNFSLFEQNGDFNQGNCREHTKVGFEDN